MILRRWRTEDRESLRRINADPVVMEFYPSTLSNEESDKIIEGQRRHFDRYGFGLFAVELKKTESMIGWVGVQNVPIEAHFTPAVEIGWRIASEHWNQGYATEAAGRVLKFSFDDINLSEVVAMTYVGNHRSRRVMEKLNMAYNPRDDFDNSHPKLRDTWLMPHVLYRISSKKV